MLILDKLTAARQDSIDAYHKLIADVASQPDADFDGDEAQSVVIRAGKSIDQFKTDAALVAARFAAVREIASADALKPMIQGSRAELAAAKQRLQAIAVECDQRMAVAVAAVTDIESHLARLTSDEFERRRRSVEVLEKSGRPWKTTERELQDLQRRIFLLQEQIRGRAATVAKKKPPADRRVGRCGNRWPSVSSGLASNRWPANTWRSATRSAINSSGKQTRCLAA